MRIGESLGFKPGSHGLNNQFFRDAFSFKTCQTEYGEYI